MVSISLCMIVRNEEEFLDQCLNNIKGHVDEIVIVIDKNQSSPVAEKFGALVIENEWNDDFSAARNESLKHATKDWILILDADEVLSVEDLEKLKSLAANEDAVAYILHQITYTSDTNQMRFLKAENLFTRTFGFAGYFETPTIRFFKNHMGFYFKRRVHEIVDDSIIEQKLRHKVKDSSLPLHHLKMLKDLKETEKRYMELSEKELRGNPLDYKAHYDIGLTILLTGGNLEKAGDYFNNCLKIRKDFNEARIALAFVLFRQEKYQEALKTYEEALKYDGKNPFIFDNIGSCLFFLKKYKEAIKVYEKALNLGHKNPEAIEAKIRQLLERL